MITSAPRSVALAGAVGFAIAACGTATTPPQGTGGSSGSGAGASGGSAGVVAGAPANAGAAGTSGGAASAGTSGSGGAGASAGTGGAAPLGGSSGASSGGTGAGTAGAGAGTGGTTGGSSGSSGSAGMPGSAGTSCTVGGWPEADPAVAGPFETVTEENVGPTAGAGADGGAPVAFTMFRPADLSESGRCHPVVTWGNGTGSTPSLYGVLLRHLASHGFVVIASDSPTVATGDPPPMVAGVTWVLEQNADPASALYQRIDAAHVGATGHSQGGFATTTAGADSQILSIAPLCGGGNPRNLHGPSFFFCGGVDMVVDCDSVHMAFDRITDQPTMFANYLTADHADWVTFRGTTPGEVEVAVTAWMRVQLMGDTALRSWFYGASCKLCTDAAWQIEQKMMDQ